MAPNNNAFYITVPSGWAVVDVRSLLDGVLLERAKEALGDGLTRVTADRLGAWLSALSSQVAAENLVMMALRANDARDVLSVFTVACPGSDLPDDLQSHQKAEQPRTGGNPDGEPILLAGGGEAVIHRAVRDDSSVRALRWASAQLVMRVPGTDTPAILTLLSSDPQDTDALCVEAVVLADSISRSTPTEPV